MSAEQLTFAGRLLPEEALVVWRRLARQRGITAAVVVDAAEQVGRRWTIALKAGDAQCAVIGRVSLEVAIGDLFTQAFGPQPGQP